MSNDEKKKAGKDAPESKETMERGQMDDQELHSMHGQVMREPVEPSEQQSPMPMGIIFFFGILMFICGSYLIHYSGNWDPFVFDETQTGGGGSAEETVEYDPIVAGKRVFAANCQTCHQADGMGMPGTYPHLAGSSWVLTDEYKLVRIVLNGLQGPLELDGKQFNSVMTPFRDTLSDKQIAEVLSYVRNSWGNEASVIPEEFVAQVRKDSKDRTTQWTPEELAPWFNKPVDFSSDAWKNGGGTSTDSADAGKGDAAKDITMDAAMSEGKRKFNLTCMACHQANGAGVPGLYPSLVGSEIGTKQDAMAVRIILHGLKGPLADGSTYPTSMAPLGEVLNDEDIALILTYARNSWGNTGELVPVDLVASIREEEKERAEEWTLPELEEYRVE